MFNWLWKRKEAPAPKALEIALPGAPAKEDPAFTQAWATLHLEATEAAPSAEGPEALNEAGRKLADEIQLLVRDHFLDHRPQPSAFPAVAVEVVSVLDNRDPELHELLRIVERDPAISMELLRAANSAFYHRGTHIQDLRAAVLRLGTRAAGEIAVGVASLALFDISQRAEYELFKPRLMTLHRQSMAIAFGASEFAFREHLGHPQHAFLGGMFHDIGHVLALKSLAALMVGGRVPQDLPTRIVEATTEGLHRELGYTALSIWALPPYLPALCAQHHDPQIPAQPESEDVHVVRLASGFYRLVENPQASAHLANTRQSLEALALDRARAADLFTLMDRKRAQVRALFPA